MNNTIEVCLFIIDETEKAFRVMDDETADYRLAKWIPKSQVETDDPDAGPGDTTVFTIPEWLAKDKELI